MGGLLAIFLAFLAFVVPLALPLAMPGLRQLGILVAVAAVFFTWLTVDMPNPGGIAAALGSFLGGLMLLGFAAGTIARLVGLIGRRPGDG